MLKNFYIWFCLILAKSVNSFNIKTPNVKSMNFNLNKDSLWISFPINNNYHSKINELIPNTHTLVKCKIFE